MSKLGLHQHVQEVPDHRDHREGSAAPLDVQYGPAHEIKVIAGGLLHSLLGAKTVTVNSLHSQGVARLAEGLTVKALADDGLVEAFTVSDRGEFALAVQWHPEWKVEENPVSIALFKAFGEAARKFASEGSARRQTDSLLNELGTASDK